MIPHCSVNMLCFPYQEGSPLTTPDEVLSPLVCDTLMTQKVLKLAMLLEDVHIVHGLGGISAAHTEEDIRRLCGAFEGAIARIKKAGAD